MNRLLALSIALTPFAALATDPPVLCNSSETMWFSGYAQDLDAVVSVCGSASMAGAEAWLQLRYGEAGGSVQALPLVRAGSLNAFAFSRYTRPRVTYLTLETAVGDLRYQVFDSYDADDPAVTGGSLTITHPNGQETSHVLEMSTEAMSLSGLEDYVPNKPFLE